MYKNMDQVILNCLKKNIFDTLSFLLHDIILQQYIVYVKILQQNIVCIKVLRYNIFWMKIFG